MASAPRRSPGRGFRRDLGLAIEDRVWQPGRRFDQGHCKHRLPGGLYWPTDLDGEISPLGPLFAHAQAEGYDASSAAEGPEPFHGYLFRVLDRQGKHAAGGRYRYVINGNMIAGFALVAWPARYGESGIMTFLVNQQGRIVQKDLGPRTTRIAGSLRSFDPDDTWHPAYDAAP